MVSTKSLLEYAVEILTAKKKPMKMTDIIKKVMDKANLSKEEMDELAPQLILDFMSSGIFWYCGGEKTPDLWDLKERQTYKDIDNGSSSVTTEEDIEAEENQLKDENEYENNESEDDELSVEKEEDDEDEDDDLDAPDDIEKELQSAK